jgi:GT2 family glycosyltransferase
MEDRGCCTTLKGNPAISGRATKVSMPAINLIVLNWNGKHFLETCLTALRRQTFRDFEAILVDNGSEDGSAEYVRAHFPEVRLLALGENRGFTGGNIAGWELVRNGPPEGLIVLLNNDTEAHPLWLEEMHKASCVYQGAGTFASKMMMFDARNRIENCGFSMSTIGFTSDLGRGEVDSPAWSEPRRVFGACAGAAAYRRSMLEDVGFLDNDFFMTAEDIDLSFRAQLRGYECWMIPSAIVYHRFRATMSKFPARQTFFTQRNSEIVYLKNMPAGLMLGFLPMRILYELGSTAYSFKMGYGGAFLKGKFDALRQLPAVLRKRQEVQRGRTVSNGHLRSRMQGEWLRSKCKKMLAAWRGPSQIELRRSP